MSGLALLSLNAGAVVTGSDVSDNAQVKALRKQNIRVFTSHKPSNISMDTSLVVYTGAIPSTNKELVRARKLGIKTMERSEFLGVLSSGYRNIIAVAGTHGKTTTTAMIAEIFTLAGLEPTIHIGGNSLGLKSNTVIGGKEYLIVEACEYRESFLSLNATIGVITNIESDHLDYYQNFQFLQIAFQKFANNCNHIITTSDTRLYHNSKTIVWEDFNLDNIEFAGNGYNFNVIKGNEYYMTCRLNMLGIYNLYNALFAIVVADKYGISKDVIEKALSGFMGVERRLETIYVFDSGCRVLIDYAHHPTEIKNSCQAVGTVYNRILYVFQPHTYSRTLSLFKEFVEVLSSLENLIIFQTYEARENVIQGGRAQDLYYVLESCNNVKYYDNVDKLNRYIENHSQDYDCVLILGAGDLAEKLKYSYNYKIIAKSIDKS